MRRAFKYRLYPTDDQTRELGIMLETHRQLYNAALEHRRYAWKARGRSVSYGDQAADLKQAFAENEYLKRTNYSSCQATLRRLDKSFTNFFRRVKEGHPKPGYPRFKGRDFFDSVCFPAYGDGVKLLGDRLRVQHVGKVKVKLHRPIKGRIKTVSIKSEGDHWYAVFSCDLGDVSIPAHDGPVTGIDVGLERFLTAADGSFESNASYLKKELPELRRAQRSFARKKRGGKRRIKTRRRVRRIHRHVKNKRREHHHQTALKLVRRYGLIAVERLNVRGMLRNRRLSRAIQDAAWSGFLEILGGKAQKVGSRIVKVAARNSSQECSRCGAVVPKTLRNRWHSCGPCGLSLHRDHNSALVILKRALARTGRAGPNAA